jgi:hypothetical protein
MERNRIEERLWQLHHHDLYPVFGQSYRNRLIDLIEPPIRVIADTLVLTIDVKQWT